MYLECCEDGMGFADYAYDHGALLHGFLCVFDLKDAALGREGDGAVCLLALIVIPMACLTLTRCRSCS